MEMDGVLEVLREADKNWEYGPVLKGSVAIYDGNIVSVNKLPLQLPPLDEDLDGLLAIRNLKATSSRTFGSSSLVLR